MRLVESIQPVSQHSTAHRCRSEADAPLGIENFAIRVAMDARQDLVCVSKSMRQAVAKAVRFARSSATVLITGESGTGKEVLARIIHGASPRAAHEYARVNCAALSESLIESELFGHERGAFTGASERRVGRIEWAAGGTLLLDEISEIPQRMQAKLLRVLEEQEFQRVGCNETQHANVRFVATSNRSLETEVSARRFRADLFHRLNVLRVDLPPLRSRRDDICELATQFVRQYRSEGETTVTGVSTQAMDIMLAHDWPGNVRQLRNVVRSACVMANGPVIRPEDLPALDDSSNPLPDRFIEMRLDDIERHVILTSLQRYNGNKTATAKHLGVSSRTLFNKIKQYRASECR